MSDYPKRIYVCHTLYHVYISLLKEMNVVNEAQGNATLAGQNASQNAMFAGQNASQNEMFAGNATSENMPNFMPEADLALSTAFMDFEDLGVRIAASTKLFRNIFSLREERPENHPEIMKYKENHHNIVRHMINRMIFTKKVGKLQDAYFDVDFKQYSDIYVFCDSDPIGYYLNYHHIPYHAVEDGLDCLKNFDAAHVDNAGHFGFKAWMAKHNFIFMQNGYSKYCTDMEINDDSFLDYSFSKYKVVPRKKLEENITQQQKKEILSIFLPDADTITARLQKHKNCILFLTEGFPGPHPEVRIQVSDEILKNYCEQNIRQLSLEEIHDFLKGKPVNNALEQREITQSVHVVIKPHPRDDVDYQRLYPMCTVIRGKFPIEVLNFIEGIHFSKAISIITSALDSIEFADEKINIGPYIYDSYEDPSIHAFMKIGWDKTHPPKDKQKGLL